MACKLLCSSFLRRHCIEVTCETHKCVCSVPLTRYASNEREISCAIGLDHSYVCLSPEKSFSQMAWQLCSNSAFDEVLKANWGCGWKLQKQWSHFHTHTHTHRDPWQQKGYCWMCSCGACIDAWMLSIYDKFVGINRIYFYLTCAVSRIWRWFFFIYSFILLVVDIFIGLHLVVAAAGPLTTKFNSIFIMDPKVSSRSSRGDGRNTWNLCIVVWTSCEPRSICFYAKPAPSIPIW